MLRLFLLTTIIACSGPSSQNNTGDDSGGGTDVGSGSGSGSGNVTSAGDLLFAIVGDTRPPSPDDTSGYPTAIITKIYQDIEAENPKIPFAISTGDYMFSYSAST